MFWAIILTWYNLWFYPEKIWYWFIFLISFMNWIVFCSLVKLYHCNKKPTEFGLYIHRFIKNENSLDNGQLFVIILKTHSFTTFEKKYYPKIHWTTFLSSKTGKKKKRTLLMGCNGLPKIGLSRYRKWMDGRPKEKFN